MGVTFADTHPEIEALAHKVIPNVFGAFKEAWMKGYYGLPQKLVKTSEYERFYNLGKEYKVKEEMRKIGGLVDAEYDVLKNMKKRDIKEYLLCLGFGKEAVNKFVKEAGVF